MFFQASKDLHLFSKFHVVLVSDYNTIGYWMCSMERTGSCRNVNVILKCLSMNEVHEGERAPLKRSEQECSGLRQVGWIGAFFRMEALMPSLREILTLNEVIHSNGLTQQAAHGVDTQLTSAPSSFLYRRFKYTVWNYWA